MKSVLTVGPPFDSSMSKRGSEMAFLMMGEMGGGGGERSLESPCGLSEVFLMCRRVLEKNAPILLSGDVVRESVSPFPLAVPP